MNEEEQNDQTQGETPNQSKTGGEEKKAEEGVGTQPQQFENATGSEEEKIPATDGQPEGTEEGEGEEGKPESNKKDGDRDGEADGAENKGSDGEGEGKAGEGTKPAEPKEEEDGWTGKHDMGENPPSMETV